MIANGRNLLDRTPRDRTPLDRTLAGRASSWSGSAGVGAGSGSWSWAARCVGTKRSAGGRGADSAWSKIWLVSTVLTESTPIAGRDVRRSGDTGLPVARFTPDGRSDLAPAGHGHLRGQVFRTGW
jgi:hypothetical protein